jgi:hypothetical protein
MIPEPPSPSGLVGEHWPQIDEVGLATVGARLFSVGAAALAAELKTMADGQAYSAGIWVTGGGQSQADNLFAAAQC